MTTTSSTIRDAVPTARQLSDDVLQNASKALSATREQANMALDKADSKVRELRGEIDPLVDMLAEKAQKLARQSLDIAAEAKEKAQQSLTRYASATSHYVAEQPMRSVLIAAAVGAVVALLVSSSRNKRDQY